MKAVDCNVISTEFILRQTSQNIDKLERPQRAHTVPQPRLSNCYFFALCTLLTVGELTVSRKVMPLCCLLAVNQVPADRYRLMQNVTNIFYHLECIALHPSLVELVDSQYV